MKTKSTSALDEIILTGMYYCPYGKDTRGCFFGWLQKKSTQEKTEWYKGLTVRDKQDLIYCHLKCSLKANTNYQKVKYYQNN